MKKTEFEEFIKEHRLESIHTFHDNFTYTSNPDKIGVYQYGVTEKNGEYNLLAIEYGDRGPCPSYSIYGHYNSEDEAFDELKKKVLFYASRTYNYSLQSSIQDFYKHIRFKKISREAEYNNETDLSFAEYLDLIQQYFPGEFVADANYGNLKVYSNQYHSIIFEVTSHNEHKKDKYDYFIPYMLKTDDGRQILSQRLDNTYCENKWDKDGIYILFYNSLTAFAKYDFNGNVLYEAKWSKDCDLRTCNCFMRFIPSSFCIEPTGYAKRHPKYPDDLYIAITNGIQYGIFNRKTGELVETNYDHTKDIPD